MPREGAMDCLPIMYVLVSEKGAFSSELLGMAISEAQLDLP